MPLTNAERQAKFQAKKRALLGDEEYKKQLREQFHYQYHKNKPIKIEKPTIEEPPIEIPDLKPLKKRANPINKSVLADNTIIGYTITAKKLYKHYTNNDLPDDCDIIKCFNSQPYKYKNIKTQFAFLFDKAIIDDVIKIF